MKVYIAQFGMQLNVSKNHNSVIWKSQNPFVYLQQIKNKSYERLSISRV